MPANNRKRFSSVDALRKFSPECLVRFFAHFRKTYPAVALVEFPAHVDEKHPLPYDKLVELCMNKTGHAPQEFLDALFYMNALASTTGRLHILSQARKDKIKVAAPNPCTGHDFVLYAWEADGHKVDLLARSLARYSGHRKRRMFICETLSVPIPAWKPHYDARKPDFVANMQEHFKGDSESGRIEITPYDEKDEVWFLMKRGGVYTRTGIMPEKGDKRDALDYYPLLYDAAVYSPSLGELRIMAAPKDREAYREEFGKLLGDSSAFFFNINLVTLDPLIPKPGKEYDPLSLEGFDGKIESIRLTEIELESLEDSKERFIHKAPNLLAVCGPDKPLILPGTKPVRAAMMMKFDKHGERTLTIFPPDDVGYTRADDAPVIEAWLRHRKFKKSRRAPPAQN